MSISDGVTKKFIKKRTINYISFVDERIIKICVLLHGALDGQEGAGSKASHPLLKLALQYSPTYTITQLGILHQLFMTLSSYTKTTLHTVMT